VRILGSNCVDERTAKSIGNIRGRHEKRRHFEQREAVGHAAHLIEKTSTVSTSCSPT